MATLDIAIKDPHPTVRDTAKQLQSQIKNAAERSAYGRRRGTAIVETERGIIVVTHDNRQFLLPGGSPKRGKHKFKLQLESYGKKRVLRLMMFAIYSLIWQPKSF